MTDDHSDEGEKNITDDNEKTSLIRRSKSKRGVDSLSSSSSSSRSSSPEPAKDTRFDRPQPSACRRLTLIVFFVLLFWLAFSLRNGLLQAKKKPQIVYANRWDLFTIDVVRGQVTYASNNRYSREHKFRPAASPIITEILKDGRTRLRGAEPEPTFDPKTARPKKAKSKRKSTKKKSPTGPKKK